MANLFRCGGGNSASLNFLDWYTAPENDNPKDFDVKDKLPSGVDYTKLKTEDFILSLSEIYNRYETLGRGSDFTDSLYYKVGWATVIPKLSYNANTGILTISNSSIKVEMQQGSNEDNTTTYKTIYMLVTYKVYLVA